MTEAPVQRETPVERAAIYGMVATGFEEVRNQFEQNFAERGELGAAVAVYWQGKKVVDLWGGIRDWEAYTPWERDTLAPFSTATAGMAAMALAAANARGWLDYQEKVSVYWPAFAQEGKQDVTVCQLLAHQAGLCAIDETLDLSKMADLDRLAEILARQKPAWEPGTKHGYHANSLGFYENELIRRVDPQGRSLGQFFQDEIAAPLGIEFYIGLPPEIPAERTARLKFDGLSGMFSHPKMLLFGLAFRNPNTLVHQAFNNPPVKVAGDFNDPDSRGVEIPSTGGVGQARAIARAYSAFANGGGELGILPETMSYLTGSPTGCPTGLKDEILPHNSCFSLGFCRPCKGFAYAPSKGAFGVPGLGGSFGFADPDNRIGYAYTLNKMGFQLPEDPRERALRRAVYASIQRLHALEDMTPINS